VQAAVEALAGPVAATQARQGLSWVEPLPYRFEIRAKG
jgi:hypothetical protein